MALHGALHDANSQLQQGEVLVGYLDDLYLLTSRSRAKAAYDLVTRTVREHAGIEPNLGKTECWCSGGGEPPEDITLLNPPEGPGVWKANLPAEQCGVEVLGSPIGTREYVQAKAADRLEEETKLLSKLPQMSNLQSAWLLLLYCAAPRANYMLRTTPPELAHAYAVAHDEAVRNTFAALMQVPTPTLAQDAVRRLLELPARFGGNGLRSSTRIAPCAYWASWADSLPVLAQRIPTFASNFRSSMVALAAQGDAQPQNTIKALPSLHAAAQVLAAEGFVNIPTWNALLQGRRPPQEDPDDLEPGEWRKGWQFHASNAREQHALHSLRQALTSSGSARLRSCAGPNAARWMTTMPTEDSLRMDDPVFRCAMARRLGLPIAAESSLCEGCGRALDEYGFHRTTCMRTGRVQSRHKFVVQAWRRVFREAGVAIPDRNVERFLRDTHIRRSESDGRRMDLVTPGIPGVLGGIPLFLDATCVSPVHGDGSPMPRAASEDGAALSEATRRNREDDYPDVEASPHARLLSTGVETYGRWSEHSLMLVRALARAKSKRVPEVLRKSAQHAFAARWWALLSVAVQKTVCSSILRPAGADLAEAESSLADSNLVDVLDFNR
jgi:hypothetical protein